MREDAPRDIGDSLERMRQQGLQMTMGMRT